MAAPCSALGRVSVRGAGCLRLVSLSRMTVKAQRQLEFVSPSWRSYSAGVSSTGEKVTHTGQVFDEGDYRKVRFVGRQKEVNEQFAIKLISEQPVTQAEDRIVSCDGGGGALGHPKVYINLDKETKTGTCGYCGLQFKQKPHH
ncbi:NADH dehydrogenase [ubiquinone] iron-sulfur protein 6, mitochondrial [Discoglossus pictus]